MPSEGTDPGHTGTSDFQPPEPRRLTSRVQTTRLWSFVAGSLETNSAFGSVLQKRERRALVLCPDEEPRL